MQRFVNIFVFFVVFSGCSSMWLPEESKVVDYETCVLNKGKVLKSLPPRCVGDDGSVFSANYPKLK